MDFEVNTQIHPNLTFLYQVGNEAVDAREAATRHFARHKRDLMKAKLPTRIKCGYKVKESGHEWRIVLMARNRYEQKNRCYVSYIPFVLNGKRGFVIDSRTMKSLVSVSTHAVERFQQRYLNARKMYMDMEDAMLFMLEKIMSGTITRMESSVNVYTDDCAFMGVIDMQAAVIYINTCVTDREMFKNQKEVVSTARKVHKDFIAKVGRRAGAGKSLPENVGASVADFSPYRRIERNNHLSRRNFLDIF